MNVTIPTKPLARALSHVAAIASDSKLQPILRNLRLSAGAESCCISATDLTQSVEYMLVYEKCAQFGEELIDAALLQKIAKTVTDESITIISDSQKLNVGGSFKLPIVDPAGYPPFPEPVASHQLSIKAADLRRMLMVCMPATDRRSNNAGVGLERHDNKLKAVATDTRRVAVCSDGLNGKPGRPSHVIPRASCASLIELLKEVDGDGEVEVSLAPNEILVDASLFSWSSRLVSERFSDYWGLMPQSPTIRVVADLAKLREIVAKAALITANTELDRIDFEISAGGITVIASDGIGKEFADTVDVQLAESLATGEFVDFGCKAEYFMDFTHAMAVGEKVDIFVMPVQIGGISTYLPDMRCGDCRYVLAPFASRREAHGQEHRREPAKV